MRPGSVLPWAAGFLAVAAVGLHALEIASISVEGTQVTVEVTGEQDWAYSLEKTESLTNADWTADGETAAAITNPVAIHTVSTNASAFFRVHGVNAPVLVSNQLTSVQRAIRAYQAEYGTYPPTNRVAFEKENPAGQPQWLRDELFLPGATNTLLWDYGLVSHLWPRGDALHDNQPTWFPDTPRDEAAKAGWAHMLRDIALASNLVERPAQTDLYYNTVLTIEDPWGREFLYECSESGLSNRFWSVGPDGVNGTVDDIQFESTAIYPEYRHGVNARDVALMGLSNAMASVDADMGGPPLLIYPPWDTLASANAGLWPESPAVITNNAGAYIPGSLLPAAQQASPGWQAATNEAGQVIGRYSYVVVNCSGLLDANTVGGTGRVGGVSAAEIQVGQLPDVVDSNTFLRDREQHVRHEAVSEVELLNDGVSSQANFATYSSIPLGKRLAGLSNVTHRVYIGSDTSSWNETAIKQAFAQSGVSAPDTAYLGLLDYVDADDVPRELGSAGGEAVPMINEAAVTYRVTVGTNGSYTLQCDVPLELFYPFRFGSTGAFQVAVMATFQALSGNTPGLLPSDISTNIDLAGPIGAHTYIVVPSQSDAAGVLVDTSNARAHFRATIRAEVRNGDGDVVDAVPYPTNNTGLRLTLDTGVIPVGGGQVRVSEWSDCIDPRFNWDPRDFATPIQWQTGAGQAGAPLPGLTPRSTIGSENELTRFLLADPGWYGNIFAANADGDTWVHVADKPLGSVGELGHLVLKPWYSLRLYDHADAIHYGPDPPYHRALDHFTLVTNAPPVKGLVNLSTTNRDVLASAFYEAPEDEYASTPDRLTWANARSVADELVALGPHTNLSALGEINWSSYATGSTELAREGLVRNSAGLLTVRQNCFTVVVRGEAYSVGVGGAGGFVLAPAYLVATVWRDPFPAPDGSHERRVVFAHWLDEPQNYPGGDSAVDAIATEFAQAVCDQGKLGCSILHTMDRAMFAALLGEADHTNRMARRLTYRLDWTNGTLVRREEQISVTGLVAYGEWQTPTETVLASNVVSLRFLTSDGSDHTTNLPDWVDVELQLFFEPTVSNRVRFIDQGD